MLLVYRESDLKDRAIRHWWHKEHRRRTEEVEKENRVVARNN